MRKNFRPKAAGRSVEAGTEVGSGDECHIAANTIAALW
jgi:hypothetical protein